MDIRSERNHLLFWLIMVLTVAFLATSASSYLVSRDAIRTSIAEQQLPLTGDNIYSEMQRDLVRPVGIAAQMAQDTFLRDWVIAGEADPAVLVRFLHEIKRKFGADTSFFISEKTRKYYYADGILKTINEADPRDAWYSRVRRMQDPYELNVDPDMASRDALTVFINYRVYDYRNNFIGVTGVGLKMGAMRQVIESIERKYLRKVFFIDAQGNTMLSGRAPVPEPAGSTAGKASAGAQNLLADIPERAALLPQIVNRSPSPAAHSYRSGAATVQVNSRYVPELKWYLVVEEDEASALQPVTNALWHSLLLGALATLLACTLTWSAIQRYQNRIELAASIDPLTGLTNRQIGETLFGHSVKEALRSRQPLSIALMDIDNFKHITDSRGHLSGDTVLRAVAAAARAVLRDADIAIRWGGDEVLVILKNCPAGDAEKIAQKICGKVAAQTFDFPNAPGSRATVSIGVTGLVNAEGSDALFARADQALYLAKNNGRNRVEMLQG